MLDPFPTPVFPDRVKLPLAFDAARLAADLAVFEGDEWIAHFVKQNYKGDWSALPLRADATATHPIMMIASRPGTTDFADTRFLARTPYFAEVLAAFECELTTVRLMRLTAGSEILEHYDHDLGAEYGWARIHIPVTTNPGVEFFVNRQPVAMKPGEAWYLRLSDPHKAANRGDTDRVHLVIDAKINDWLTAQLESGAASAQSGDQPISASA